MLYFVVMTRTEGHRPPEHFRLLEKIQPTKVKRAAYISHNLWRIVKMHQISASETPEKKVKFNAEKPLNFKNIYDRYTFNALKKQNNQSLRKNQEGGYVVDILDVDLSHVPDNIRQGTFKSTKAALKVIKSRVDNVKKNIHSNDLIMILNRQEILKQMSADVIKILDLLHRKQAGEKLLDREEAIFRNNWVTEGSLLIHGVWAKGNPDREELAGEFFKLDAFEQEKDVVFIDAAIRAEFESTI